MRLRERCDCYDVEASRSLSREEFTAYRMGGWGRQPEKDCFHGTVTVRRIFRSADKVLLENEAGYVRLYEMSEVYAN